MANSAPNIPSALFPIVSRNRSCSTDPQKQSQLPQLALRLACILDKFISKNAEVTEKDMIDLEDAGNEFKVRRVLKYTIQINSWIDPKNPNRF